MLCFALLLNDLLRLWGHCSGQYVQPPATPPPPATCRELLAFRPMYHTAGTSNVPRATVLFKGQRSPSKSSTTKSGQNYASSTVLGVFHPLHTQQFPSRPRNLDLLIFGGGNFGVASQPTVLPNSQQKSAEKKRFQETVRTPRDTP